jgi:hypothetical protein
MLVNIAYDKDYLRNQDSVKKLEEVHNSLVKFQNNVSKPTGKRIFTPLFVELSRRIHPKKVSFVKDYKRTDKLFLFVTFCCFYLLLRKMKFDFKTALFANALLAFYLLYGFNKVFPVWRFSDQTNLMLLVSGIYFIVSDYKIAFLVNLAFMTLNKETSIILVLILGIKLLLDNEQNIKAAKFSNLRNDTVYFILSLMIYAVIQIILGKFVSTSVQPWGGKGFGWALSYYSAMNFTADGFRFSFSWFNILLILAILNFFKKTNLVKSSLFSVFLYVLSVYSVGGLWGEGEGLLLPIAPILVLAAIEELKILNIL